MKRTLSISRGIRKQLPKTSKAQASPGVGGYVGVERETPVRLQFFHYDEKEYTEKVLSTVSEISGYSMQEGISWLNVTGVHDDNVIQEIGRIFSIHPLVLEDISNTTQRPKVEEYDDYLFVVLKMASTDEKSKLAVLEQVSLIVGSNYVISLQEQEGDVLDSLRDRIRHTKGRIRTMGSDYLLYGIVDSVVDNYFAVLENIGTAIEEQEDWLLSTPNQDLLDNIYGLKRELVFLRKSIWPMREVANTLQHSDHIIIKKATSVFFRDIYDHTIQVVEAVETFRDMMTSMLDLYLSTVSNKMNEIMKVLTIFAAIFIPLTFIAGVYGMNFEFMPELKWKLGYAFWWLGALILTGGMLIYFKRKKWL
jgi:magnesium transporter